MSVVVPTIKTITEDSQAIEERSGVLKETMEEVMCSLRAEGRVRRDYRKMCSPEVDNTWESVVVSSAVETLPMER